MHIKEYIDTVSGAEIEDAVHIVEILVVIAAGLGLDHAPSGAEADKIESARGHLVEQFIVDIEAELVVLAVFALIYDIDAVEDTLSDVFIDKAVVLMIALSVVRISESYSSSQRIVR